MTRFSPDHDIVDNLIHVVYRYNTHEVDNEGLYIYRPISFQNDLEDITFTYGNMELTSFDPTNRAEAEAAFNNVIRAYDTNVAAEVSAKTMDAFQMMQHVADFLHVGSKLLPTKFDIPAAANANTAGIVKLYGEAGNNTDGAMTQKSVGATYATKSELSQAIGTLIPPSTGTATQPIYIDNSGNIKACTYSLNKTVPSDAVFTDTKYYDFVKSGASAAAGLVPKPSTTAGNTRYLREDGTWSIPPNDNTDTKVTNTLESTTKFFVTGTASAVTNTGTQYFDSGVYVSTRAGELVASRFTGELNGTAAKATADADGNVIKTTYATKQEIPSVWDSNGKLVSPVGEWSVWVSD